MVLYTSPKYSATDSLVIYDWFEYNLNQPSLVLGGEMT